LGGAEVVGRGLSAAASHALAAGGGLPWWGGAPAVVGGWERVGKLRQGERKLFVSPARAKRGRR